MGGSNVTATVLVAMAAALSAVAPADRISPRAQASPAALGPADVDTIRALLARVYATYRNGRLRSGPDALGVDRVWAPETASLMRRFRTVWLKVCHDREGEPAACDQADPPDADPFAGGASDPAGATLKAVRPVAYDAARQTVRVDVAYGFPHDPDAKGVSHLKVEMERTPQGWRALDVEGFRRGLTVGLAEMEAYARRPATPERRGSRRESGCVGAR